MTIKEKFFRLLLCYGSFVVLHNIYKKSSQNDLSRISPAGVD